MNTELPLPPDPHLAFGATAPKTGVMLATPVRHYEGWDTLPTNLKLLMNRLTELSGDPGCPYEFHHAVMKGGLVRARNVIAHEFKKRAALDPNLKWLITRDDDVVDPSDSDPAGPILRLLAHRQPFVGALYTTKEEKGHWVASFLHNVVVQKGTLLQVLEVGGGLTATHLKVFTEVDRMMPEFRYTDRDTGERMTPYYQHCMQFTDTHPDGDLLPEDYFFCFVLRRLMIGLFVDTSLKLKHAGGDGVLYPTGDWPPIPIDDPVDDPGALEADIVEGEQT